MLQNRALKVCLKLDIRTDTIDVHTSAKANFLADRRLSHIYLEGFKRAQSQSYIRVIGRDLRCTEAPLLKNKLPHTESYKKGLEYMVSVIWNDLSVDIRSIKNKLEFKYKIKGLMKQLIPGNPGIT